MLYKVLSLLLLFTAASVLAQADDSTSLGGALLECNKIYSYVPENNYGASDQLTVLAPGSSSDRRGIIGIAPGVLTDSIPVGDVVDSAHLYVYTLVENNAYVSLHRVFVRVYEGTGNGATIAGATDWNHVYHADSAWTTAGGNTSDNNGVRHSATGTGADRAATPLSTVYFDTPTSWTFFSVLDVVFLQEAVDNGYEVSLMMIGNTVNMITTMASDDYATTGLRPYLMIYHHTPPTDGTIRRHVKGGHLEGGQL